jgi:transposase
MESRRRTAQHSRLQTQPLFFHFPQGYNALQHMYLKCHARFKDGKEHRYYSIAEKVPCAGGRQVERHVFYLGAINASQKEAWLKCIEAFDVGNGQQIKLALFASDASVPAHAVDCAVQVRLSEFSVRRARQWGACWVFVRIWEELKLDEFWAGRLPASREHTSWYHILVVLCAYRLIDPGSEWRLHREWYDRSAMADLLGEDFALAAKDNLYRCLDKLLEHKEALFSFLKGRWQDLFGVTFDVLLYDLTSTYFESEPPVDEEDKRRFGHSRDKRSDCVQVVIALVVTPEGFPLAYEVLAGNTSDRKTLKSFLEKIQSQYGKARRIWVMDRGAPTQAVLEEMRQASDPAVQYVVGTPKGQLSKLEADLLKLPWQQVRPSVRVKLLAQEQELFVLVNSQARVSKERAIRRRKLKALWKRLQELKEQQPSYEALLMKLGAAKTRAGRVWSLVKLTLPEIPRTKKARQQRAPGFEFALKKDKLRAVFKREGRYVLRTNLKEEEGAKVWEFYLQLVEVEEAFKNLKGDLAIRPIFHQLQGRIEAHIFVCFLAYCVHVTLRHQLRAKAPGLTVRQVLEKLGRVQMMDVHFPTTDGRELVFVRYTQPEKDQQLVLAQMKWELPPQSPPRITAKGELENSYRPLPPQA